MDRGGCNMIDNKNNNHNNKKKNDDNTHPITNNKASTKKLDSQISYFRCRFKDLIIKYYENSLLKHKKSRLSLEKGYFLLDRGGLHTNEPPGTSPRSRVHVSEHSGALPRK